MRDHGETVGTSGLTRTTWVAIAIAIVAFALGFVAYVSHVPVATAVYDTLGLFTLNFTVPPGTSEGSLPIVLEIARFVAPAVTVLAIVGIALRIFRDQLDLLRARRTRGHVVVCGLGDVGSNAARFLRAHGERVVVVERDANGTEIATVRALGIPVVVGDATVPRIQRRAGLNRAGRLIWTGDEWGLGQAVVNTWQLNLAPREAQRDGDRHGPEAPARSLVRVRDLALCTELRRQALSEKPRDVGAPLDVDYFNEAENAAQRLLWKVTRGYATVAHGAPVALWILGDGQLAEALVVQAARNWWGARNRPALSVHLFGQHAGELEARIRPTWPEVSEACALVVHAGPEELATARSSRGAAAGDALGAFVVVDDRDRAMHLAFRLREETEIPMTAVAATGGELGRNQERRLLRFDPTSYGLESDVLLFDTYELLARMIHEHYTLAHALRDDGTLESDPDPYGTRREWNDLDPRWRASNRDAARYVVPNLVASGFEVRRLAPSAAEAAGELRSPLDSRHLEDVAQREHERWRTFMVANGYRQAPGRADRPDGGTRPNLVPWSEASDDDREYTRQQVKDYPRLLAQLGFRITLREQSG